MDLKIKTEIKVELTGNDKTSHQQVLELKDLQKRNFYDNIDIKSEIIVKDEPLDKEAQEDATNDDVFEQISRLDENQNQYLTVSGVRQATASTAQTNTTANQVPAAQLVQLGMQHASIPVQIPISTGGGGTIFQTIPFPVQIMPIIVQANGQTLQVMPQLTQDYLFQQQQMASQPQIAQILMPNGQIQQIQMVTAGIGGSGGGMMVSLGAAAAGTPIVSSLQNVTSSSTWTTTGNVTSPSAIMPHNQGAANTSSTHSEENPLQFQQQQQQSYQTLISSAGQVEEGSQVKSPSRNRPQTSVTWNQNIKKNDKKNFSCKHCNLIFKIKDELKSHLKTHNKRKFKCAHFNYESNRKSNLKTHLPIHSNVKLFKCSDCSYESNHKEQVKLHMLNHHIKGGKIKLFRCSDCSYECNERKSLKLHMLNKHSKIKLFICSECSFFGSNEKSKLKLHLLTHGNTKLFKCSDCSYGCNQKGSLKRHILSHHQE